MKIACYFYTDISADSNGILVEKREEFLTAGYAVSIVTLSRTNFVQFVQNQNIVKTRLVFPTKARNAGNSWKVLMIILVDIECIDYSWIFDCWVSSFLNNRAREFTLLYAEAKRIRRQQKRNII